MDKWEWLLSVFLAAALILLTALYFQKFQPYQLGLKFLKDQNYTASKKEFLSILEKKPFLFPIRLNLALVESLQKNIPYAIGEYQVVAEDSSDKEERFQAHFNIALLQFLSGKIPSTLEHYQQALQENPESMEVKVNIELMMLIQQQEKKQQDQKEQEQREQREQEQREQREQDQKEQEQQKENSQSDSEQKMEETDKEKMNEDQIQFIFRELEEREKKLRSRLQDQKGKRKRGKSW